MKYFDIIIQPDEMGRETYTDWSWDLVTNIPQFEGLRILYFFYYNIIYENDVLVSKWHRYTRKKIRVLLSGVEPKSFRFLVRMLYHWATGDSLAYKAIKLGSSETNILHTARTWVSCVAYAQWK